VKNEEKIDTIVLWRHTSKSVLILRINDLFAGSALSGTMVFAASAFEREFALYRRDESASILS
jgi:hypothetical protein